GDVKLGQSAKKRPKKHLKRQREWQKTRKKDKERLTEDVCMCNTRLITKTSVVTRKKEKENTRNEGQNVCHSFSVSSKYWYLKIVLNIIQFLDQNRIKIMNEDYIF